MPFKSEKQRRYMHANLPDIAKRWERDYASGGIARLGYQQGNWVAPFYNTNVMQGSVIPPDMGIYDYQHPMGTNIYGMDEMNTYSQLPMGTDTIGMNEMFSYPRIKPDYNFGQDIDQTYMEGDFNVSPKQPAWYNRMFNKARQGITGIKNKFTGAYDTSQNFLKNIIDNTMIGRVMAGFDATNPNAFNYNPALQGQIDFLKDQGMYGVIDNTGLNKIMSGVLKGKNLQSMFGSNDLSTMYDKSIARTQKTIENLPQQWSQLAKTNPKAFAEKMAIHKARLKKKQDEYNIFKANQEKIRQAKIAQERAAGAAANQATQRRAGRGGDHMSRSRDQGGLGISKSQAQAVSDANRAAGMGGWGLAKGGLASLWQR